MYNKLLYKMEIRCTIKLDCLSGYDKKTKAKVQKGSKKWRKNLLRK